MLKKCGGLILVLLLIISIFLPGRCLADEGWDYKVTLVKHQVEIKINSEVGKYDGTDFSTTPPISQNSRIYIPLRLLKDTGLAEIVWDAANRTADLITADQDFRLRYQINKPVLSYIGKDEQGIFKVWDQKKIPAPVAKNGCFYIPVQYLDQFLRKNVKFIDNTLTIYWKVPLIERNSSADKTDDDTKVINIASEVGMPVPVIMEYTNIGCGGSLQNGKKEEISLDGKQYYLTQVTLPLQPGDNPFYLLATGGNQDQTEPFVIQREVADSSSVPIYYWDSSDYINMDMKVRDVFEITEPASGYVKLAAPGKMDFKGRLKVDSFGDNTFYVRVGKLVKGEYTACYEKAFPVTNGLFGDALDFSEPGSYLLEILSQVL